MLQYRDDQIDVITLSFTKHRVDRIVISVYGRVDFGTGTFLAVSDLVWSPLFALALCWWAGTIVASSESSYSLASRLSTWKI